MLEKKQTINKIEECYDLEGNIYCLQIRMATYILEDKKIISTKYHRHTLTKDSDISNELDIVKSKYNLLFNNE